MITLFIHWMNSPNFHKLLFWNHSTILTQLSTEEFRINLSAVPFDQKPTVIEVETVCEE